MDQGPLTVSESANRLGTARWTVLILFTLSLLLLKLGSCRTFTYHEGYVAECAQEMLDTGDWLIPRVSGVPYLEKPPMAYWAVAVLGGITGTMDEFLGRFPSVLIGLAIVLIVASLAARHYGPTLGLLAGLVQATMLYFVTYARLAEVDIHLMLLVLAGLVVFAAHWVDPPGQPHWYTSRLMFFLILGATQLAKGPLFGAVLLLLPCIAFLIPLRVPGRVSWFLSWPGILAVLVLTLAWPIAVLVWYPEAWPIWYEHIIGRFTEGFINSEPPWYYFTTLPWQIFPWTLILLPALPASLRQAWREPRSLDRFLWLWVVLQFAVLSCSRGKHHHYLIHTLPPFSIWAARGLASWQAWAVAWWNRPAWRWSVLALAAGVQVGAVLFLADRLGQAIQWELGIVAGLLLGVTAFICWSCARGKSLAAGTALFLTLWCCYAYAHWTWLARTDLYEPETLLFHRLASREDCRAGVIAVGMDPSRAILYTHAPVTGCKSAKELPQCLEHTPTDLVIGFLREEADMMRAVRLERIDRTPANPTNHWMVRRPDVGLYRVLRPVPGQ